MRNLRSMLLALLAAATATAMGQSGLAQLSKLPPLARLQAKFVGNKPTSDIVHIAVSIGLADPAGMQAFVDSVSNPYSANYGKFITPSVVGAKFGRPLYQVREVADYLTSHGMTVRKIAQNRQTILADATVGQAQEAFHTVINRYSWKQPRTGKTTPEFAFNSTLMAPAEIARCVVNIEGLDSFTKAVQRSPLTPSQIRGLYNVAPIYNAALLGQGRTVGITSFDGFDLTNLTKECQQFGLPTPPGGAGKNVTIETIDGGSQHTSPMGEGDLDIQAVICMAPLCNLIVYDGGNDDIIGVLTQEADENKADLITESYGWQMDTATALAAHNLHLAMSAQGITYSGAAGDTGTNLQGLTYPNIDPEVLMLGGTSVAINALGERTSEVVWNNTSGIGGGGWAVTTDTFNVHPAYQVGNGVPSAGAVKYRLYPDLSLDADPNTGYEIFYTGQLFEFGGTSAASPTYAGAMADCEQKLIQDGFLHPNASGNSRLGRMQDLLYSFNGDHNVFFDVLIGTNGTLPNGRPSRAGRGWDTASGWGAINFANFVGKVEGTVPTRP